MNPAYVLCLSCSDITALNDIEPKGKSTYSASGAYDEEQRIDHERLAHWLDYFHLEKVGGLPGAEKGRILPVHTQKLGWIEQWWPEKVCCFNPISSAPRKRPWRSLGGNDLTVDLHPTA